MQLSKLNRLLKISIYISIVAWTIFLLGGGPDFVVTLVTGLTIASYYPKLTALAPAAMFFLILGFTGIMMLYWGGKDYHQNENLARKRLIASINLLGASYVGLELILRFGLESI